MISIQIWGNGKNYDLLTSGDSDIKLSCIKSHHWPHLDCASLGLTLDDVSYF